MCAFVFKGVFKNAYIYIHTTETTRSVLHKQEAGSVDKLNKRCLADSVTAVDASWFSSVLHPTPTYFNRSIFTDSTSESKDQFANTSSGLNADGSKRVVRLTHAVECVDACSNFTSMLVTKLANSS